VSVDRGRFTCVAAGESVVAVKARELGRRAVVVGDVVALVGEVSPDPDALARIVRVRPRRTALRRTADDADPVERVVVANADQMAVVVSLADPPPRPRLIDRCLAAAYDGGVAPLLCLTKADLAPPEPVLAIYAPVGVPHVVVGADGASQDAGLPVLRTLLAGHTSVLVGHSGVGKSTLVNQLLPDAGQRTGPVNAVTGRGRHTTSAAVALAYDEHSWVIDTPGIRSFGLAHLDTDGLVRAFPDLAGGVADCPTDCHHLDPTVCGLDAWVAAGRAHPKRLDSLRRLLVARDED
jgi:ribosome biogenesis GTPase